ncbi:TPA: phage tail protein [Proteus mirabilis]
MSQSAITLAFERWKASATEAQQPVILDEFVLANVPNLDPSKPIDRNEGLPDAKYIMHRQAVNKTGVVNQNAVAYSVTIGAEIGDFDFNWIGLLNKQSGTVAMIVHAPTQRKIKTQAGQQGNVLTRSFLLEYLGASKETAITTPAEMWQIDFTARLSGIDEMQRLINRDKYGVASFFNNGFLVAKAGNQFYITKGLGYIEGLRAELAENKNITVTNQATKVWVDVSYQGNITSDWGVHIAITVKPDLKNYTDNAGFAHFVFAVASISVTGVITDLRPKGTLDAQYFEDALKKHEQSRNHPDATTTGKGFTKLNNQVGDSENTALTPYGAKKELEKYQPKGNYQPAGNYVTTETFNLEINKKIDKSNISQQLANDVNKVPSLDLVTKELGNKQPKGNYALKSSKDHFQSGEHKITGNYATLILETADGASFFLEKKNNYPTPYFVNRDASGVTTSVIDMPNKSGTLALIDDIDNKLKNYQPKGNYALVGESYTKAESDGKYQPKGNYALKSSKDHFQSGAHTITGKYATLHLLIEDGRRLLLEREPEGTSYFAFKDAADRTTNQVIIPERSGTIALLSDIEGSNNIPVGSPIPWSLGTAPSGYLICNGQTFNKSTYPKLAIAYPSGKLPDLRGEFIRGLDSGRGVDNERKVLSMQSGNSLLSAMWRGTVTGQQDWENKTSYNVEIGTNNSGYFTIGQQIEGSGSNETRPRNIAFLYIVRAA